MKSTPLHLAVMRGNREIVEELIQGDSDALFRYNCKARRPINSAYNRTIKCVISKGERKWLKKHFKRSKTNGGVAKTNS